MEGEAIQIQPFKYPTDSQEIEQGSKAWAFGQPLVHNTFASHFHEVTVTDLFNQAIKAVLSTDERLRDQLHKDADEHARQIAERKRAQERVRRLKGGGKTQVATQQIAPNAPHKIHQEQRLPDGHMGTSHLTPDPTEAGIKFVICFHYITGTKV
ncbi:MAG: hypothetical protein AB7F31_01025 [Parachlamydiales bacterium]